MAFTEKDYFITTSNHDEFARTRCVEFTRSFSEHPEWHVHIYGKKVNKVNRKMGHITKLSTDLNKDENQFNQLFEGRND